MKEKFDLYCLVRRKFIRKTDCQPNSTDVRCLQCAGGPKEAILACDPQDLDKAFYQAIIQPFLSNKEAIETICNLPDKKEIMKRISTLPEERVSDEAFFALLRDDREILSTPLAQMKIEKWQEKVRTDNDRQAEQSRDNLRRIGSELAYKGWAKPGTPYVLVAHCREKIFKKIKEKRIGDQPHEGRREILEKEFGKRVVNDMISAEFGADFEMKSSEEFFKDLPPGQLADCLTGAILSLKPGVVKKYRKKCEKIPLPEEKSAFVRRPTKR